MLVPNMSLHTPLHFLPLFLAGGDVHYSLIVRLAFAQLVMLRYYDISTWCCWLFELVAKDELLS